MADKSAIDRIKELDEERATLFDQAKGEALRKANEAVAELNALGLHYELVNPDEKTKVKEKAAPGPSTAHDANRRPTARDASRAKQK
jgi:hypothetical protein